MVFFILYFWKFIFLIFIIFNFYFILRPQNLLLPGDGILQEVVTLISEWQLYYSSMTNLKYLYFKDDFCDFGFIFFGIVNIEKYSLLVPWRNKLCVDCFLICSFELWATFGWTTSFQRKDGCGSSLIFLFLFRSSKIQWERQWQICQRFPFFCSSFLLASHQLEGRKRFDPKIFFCSFKKDRKTLVSWSNVCFSSSNL